MPDQEILDLDALKPTTITVRLKGKNYQVPAAEGFPLGAAFDAAKMGTASPEHQVEVGINLLVTHFGLPREDLLAMSAAQFSALMRRLLPAREAPVARDPPQPGPEPAKS